MNNRKGHVFPPGGAGGGGMQININAADLPRVHCPGVIKKANRLCESTVFIPMVELHVAPALLTGLGKATVVQMPVFVCAECKTIVRPGDEDPAVKAASRRATKKGD